MKKAKLSLLLFCASIFALPCMAQTQGLAPPYSGGLSPQAAGKTTFSNITSVPADSLLGNSTGSARNAQAITLGTNLSFSGTTLNAAGGSQTPWQSDIDGGGFSLKNTLFIEDSLGNPTIWPNQSQLVFPDGDASVDWGNMNLSNDNTGAMIDWSGGNPSGAVQSFDGSSNTLFQHDVISSGNVFAQNGTGADVYMGFDYFGGEHGVTDINAAVLLAGNRGYTAGGELVFEYGSPFSDNAGGGILLLKVADPGVFLAGPIYGDNTFSEVSIDAQARGLYNDNGLALTWDGAGLFSSQGATFGALSSSSTLMVSGAATLSGGASLAHGQLSEVKLSSTSINAKNIANTSIYTAPSGGQLIITRFVVTPTAVSSITVGPSAGIGTSAGTNNISSSQTMTALTTTSNTFEWPIVGASVPVASSGSVFFNLGTAATGTSQTIQVDLFGYFK